MITKIEPCLIPGCDGEMHHKAKGANGPDYLLCMSCGARGPEIFPVKSGLEAIQAHNTAARRIRALISALNLTRSHLVAFHEHDSAGNKQTDCISCAKINAALAPFKEKPNANVDD